MIAPFATERLAMRPMRIEDAEALHEIYSDPEAVRFLSDPPFETIDQSRARLAKGLAGDWRGWAITLGDDRAIGTVAAHEKRQGKVFEIGYLLARAHWGKGYAREAVTALIELLIREDGARRVFADTDPENAASRRLLESLGFRLEGTLREEWETHIGVRDTALYGLLAREWTAE